MIRRYGAELRTLLMLADAGVAVVVVLVLSAVRFGPDWPVFWRDALPQPLAFLIVYTILWVALLTLNGLYRPRSRWSLLTEATDIARATAAMALISLSVLFWFKLPDVSRVFLILLFPVQASATVGTRALMRRWFEWRRRRGRNLRHVLVLGGGPRGQAFAAKLEEHRPLGLRVMGFLDDDPAFSPPARWPYLGRLDRLEAILHGDVVDEVAVCLPFTQWNLIDAIAQLCEEEGKIVRVPMDVLERPFAIGHVEELDGTPVYSLVSGPDRVLALAIKRFVDLAVSGLLLLLLSPVLAAISLAIRTRDGGSILFRQTRLGLHGRPFEVLKFRTMVPDAEARYPEVVGLSDPRAFKVTNDPRVTRTGAFLRRTSLDELPQLWNVLRGEMSLVGPRPAPPREVEEYDVWHRRRLSMKPGITGLWQVTARREDDFENRATLDLSYIDRWSLWLDLKILLRTIPAAFDGR
jgi:exopolysaccharide biosynthesis polyprenyl glycosylphosphotransferase